MEEPKNSFIIHSLLLNFTVFLKFSQNKQQTIHKLNLGRRHFKKLVPNIKFSNLQVSFSGSQSQVWVGSFKT